MTSTIILFVVLLLLHKFIDNATGNEVCSYNMLSSIEIYWLNMARSQDRRVLMEQMLNQMKVKHFRVTALSMDEIYIPQDVESSWSNNNAKYQSLLMPSAKVDGDNNEFSKYKAVISGLYGRRKKNRINEVGCTISHLIAMKKAVQSKTRTSNYALIVEDDVYFPFDINFDSLVATAPDDWAILQLFNSNDGTMAKYWNSYRRRMDNTTLWIERFPGQVAGIWSTCAYLINIERIKPIINGNAMYTEHNGWLDFKLIAGLIQSPCTPKDSPCCVLNENNQYVYTVDSANGCVHAPNGFAADSLLYMMAKTYVLSVPIITNGRGGNESTFHQEHVESIHAKAFMQQRNYVNTMLKGVVPMPNFLKNPCITPKLLSETIEVKRSATCTYPKLAKSVVNEQLEVYWINGNNSASASNHTVNHLHEVGIYDKVNRIESVHFNDVYIPSKVRSNSHSHSCFSKSGSAASRDKSSTKSHIVTQLCGKNKNALDENLVITMSHLKALHKAVNSATKATYALVIEDNTDFRFDLDLDALIQSVYTQFGVDKFAMLQLTSTNHYLFNYLWHTYSRNQTKQWEDYNPKLNQHDSYSTSAYLINKNVLRPLINKVVTYSEATKQYSYNIIAGVDLPCFPIECCSNGAISAPLFQPSSFERPSECVLSPKGFSVHNYLYSLFPSANYMYNIPLFANEVKQIPEIFYKHSSLNESSNENDLLRYEDMKIGIRAQRDYINKASDDINALPKHIIPACKTLLPELQVV